MNVTLFATLRQAAGTRTTEVPVPTGSTVQDVLNAVTTIYPQLRPMLLDDSGAMLGNVHVIVNGRDAWYLSHGLETPLAETDTVLFFPAVGGVADSDGVVVGPGWRLTLGPAPDYVIGSLRVGRVRLVLEGQPEAVAVARAALERKMLRAGG